MAENFPGSNPDFNLLAEKPEKSKTTPEKKLDDDDDDDFETPPKPEKTPEKSEKSDEKDKKVPLESLADDEKQMVVEARKEEVGAELAGAEPDSIEEQEALIAATYLEVLAGEIAADQTVEQALDSSVAIALDIAGVEVPTEDIDDPTIPTVATPTTPPGNPGLPTNNPNLPPVVPNTPTSPPNLPPTLPNPIYTGGGAGGLPPSTPNIYPGFSANSAPNLAPNVVPEVVTNTVYERRSAAGPLLVGGILGYMIGRRRGRIKTEKKLLPVQKKLETQVGNLQTQIAEREAKIRKIVREQVVARPEMPAKIVERMQILQEIKHVKTAERAEPKLAVIRPERLGMFAMASEQIRSAEKVPEKPKNVAAMTTAELLAIAEKIDIEQSTIKKLFETGRLDDRGLRRIIRAYLSGEKLQKTIVENLQTIEQRTNIETLSDQPNSKPSPAFSAAERINQLAGLQSSGQAGNLHYAAGPSSLTSANNQASKSIKKSNSRLALVALAVVVIVAIIIWVLA